MSSPRTKQRLYIVMLFTIIGVLAMVYSITKKVSLNTNYNFRYLTAHSLDSVELKIDLKSEDTTLVFIFNSECEICKIELEELLIDYPKFESFRILILSRQDIKYLLELSDFYSIWNYPNISFIKIDDNKTEEPFLSSPNPSVFVFNKKGELIHTKKGYSQPEILIQQIHTNDENR